MARRHRPRWTPWHFLADESGVTAIEYALVFSVTSLILYAAVGTAGDSLTLVMTEIKDAIESVGP